MAVTQRGLDWLSDYLQSLELSQVKLGTVIGVAPKSIGDWRNALRIPSTESIDPIAEFLGLYPGQFLELLNERIADWEAFKVYVKTLPVDRTAEIRSEVAELLKGKEAIDRPFEVRYLKFEDIDFKKFSREQLIEIRNWIQESPQERIARRNSIEESYERTRKKGRLAAK